MHASSSWLSALLLLSSQSLVVANTKVPVVPLKSQVPLKNLNDNDNDQAATPNADSKKKGKVSFGSDVTFRQKTERTPTKKRAKRSVVKKTASTKTQETDSIVIPQKESILSHHFYHFFAHCRYSIAFFGGHGVRYYWNLPPAREFLATVK